MCVCVCVRLCVCVCIGALERLNCVVLTSNTCNKHVQTNVLCLYVCMYVCARETAIKSERDSVGRDSLARLCQRRVDRFNHPTKNPLPAHLPLAHTHTHTHRTYLCTHIKPLFYFIKTHTQTFTQAAKHIRTHPLCRQRPPTNLPPSIHFQYFPLPIPDPSLQASAPALLPGRQPLPPVINFHMR